MYIDASRPQIFELEKQQQPGVKLHKLSVFLAVVPLVTLITLNLLKWKENGKKERNTTQKNITSN